MKIKTVAKTTPLFKKIDRIIWKNDPIGLVKLGCPRDEYESEVVCIYCAIESNMSQKRLQNLVFNTFKFWFGKDECGPKENYLKIAKEIKKVI